MVTEELRGSIKVGPTGVQSTTLQSRPPVKYRRFTGRRCAPNTGTGSPRSSRGQAFAEHALARLKSKTRPRRWAPDARMSLCTYCHAPPAPGKQAGFDLSPLFRGADHGRLMLARSPTLRRSDGHAWRRLRCRSRTRGKTAG